MPRVPRAAAMAGDEGNQKEDRMAGHKSRSNPRHACRAQLTWLVIACALGAAATAFAEPPEGRHAPAAPAQPPRHTGVAHDSPAEAASGMRVYIDPQTGRFAPPPDAPPLPLPEPGGAQSQVLEGLVEVPGSSAAGGYTVNLRRRFGSAFVSTAGADGAVSTECVPAPAAAEEKK